MAKLGNSGLAVTLICQIAERPAPVNVILYHLLKIAVQNRPDFGNFVFHDNRIP